MEDHLTLRITGIKVNYLYVCERKLWLFDRGIQMESDSEKVLIGKLLSEYSYPRENKKELLIDNLINIDLVKGGEIYEVKSSNRLAHADRIQLLYYLFYLKQLGINKKGSIRYPKMRKIEHIALTPKYEKEVKAALNRIKLILQMENPPRIERKSICNNCSYYLFCFG